jgi:hypothetical protein
MSLHLVNTEAFRIAALVSVDLYEILDLLTEEKYFALQPVFVYLDPGAMLATAGEGHVARNNRIIDGRKELLIILVNQSRRFLQRYLS